MAHPYGTGSVFSEPGSCQPQRVFRNRALGLQSWFRRNSRWAFWSLDMMIKRHLFFNNKYSSYAKSSSAADPDNFARTYGTVIPSRIPESSAWWPASGNRKHI